MIPASVLQSFDKALERDVKNRARTLPEEIAFVQRRRADCAVLMDLLDAGKLPLRVTHNDTKLNNLLFDAHTGEALCVIDLDAVACPGLALNDYGDAIRFGASAAAEERAGRFPRCILTGPALLSCIPAVIWRPRAPR